MNKQRKQEVAKDIKQSYLMAVYGMIVVAAIAITIVTTA